MSQKLHNYLRTYRKRAGLSQREIAYLLGGHDGASVSRYEQGSRQPRLEVILAYEFIFNAPGWELFAGSHEKVQTITLRRARILARKLATTHPNPVIAKKLTVLGRLTSRVGLSTYTR
jgi:transcriptional regulator with XRE-family HTH domain